MKKFRIAILALIACALCALMLSACQCKHDYGDYETVTAAACETAGENIRTCKKCGETEKTTVAALGHEYGTWISATAPTCERDGSVAHYHCARCDKNFDAEKAELSSVTLPAGHTLVSVPARAADCDTDGVLAHENCTVCGKNFIDGIEIGDEELKITHEGHKYTVVSGKAATCTEAGRQAHLYCDGCHIRVLRGTTMTEAELNIPAAHKPVSIAGTHKTCTTDGTADHERCVVCGQLFLEGREVTAIDLVVPASHRLETVPEIPATCKAEGRMAYEHCLDCDVILKNGKETTAADLVTDAKGHTFGNLIENEGERPHYTCTSCGVHFDDGKDEEITVLTLPSGHNFSGWTPRLDATCETAGHLGYYTCSDEGCKGKYFDIDYQPIKDNYTYLWAGHVFGDYVPLDEWYHVQYCTRCGSEGYKTNHAVTYVYKEKYGKWYRTQACDDCSYVSSDLYEVTLPLLMEPTRTFVIGLDNARSFYIHTVHYENSSGVDNPIGNYLADGEAFAALLEELSALASDRFPLKRTVKLREECYEADVEITFDLPRTEVFPESPIYQKGYIDSLDDILICVIRNNGEVYTISLSETEVTDDGGFDPTSTPAEGGIKYTVKFRYEDADYQVTFTFIDKKVPVFVLQERESILRGRNLQVKFLYSDGTFETTDLLTVCRVVGGTYDKFTVGEQTFTYETKEGDVRGEMTVRVLDPKDVEDVEYEVYVPVGTSRIPLPVTYNDGTHGVVYVTEYMIVDDDGTSFSPDTPGEYYLGAYVGERIHYFYVYVYDPVHLTPTEIAIGIRAPLLVKVDADGNITFPNDGVLMLDVTMSDGSKRRMAATADMMTLDRDSNILTVRYGDVSETVRVTVFETTPTEATGITFYDRYWEYSGSYLLSTGGNITTQCMLYVTTPDGRFYIPLAAAEIYKDGKLFDLSTAEKGRYAVTFRYGGAESAPIDIIVYHADDVEMYLSAENGVRMLTYGTRESVMKQMEGQYFYCYYFVRIGDRRYDVESKRIRMSEMTLADIPDEDFTHTGTLVFRLSYEGETYSLEIPLVPDLSLYASRPYTMMRRGSRVTVDVYENGYIVNYETEYVRYTVIDSENNVILIGEDEIFCIFEETVTIESFAGSMLKDVTPVVYRYGTDEWRVYTKNGISYVDFWEYDSDEECLVYTYTFICTVDAAAGRLYIDEYAYEISDDGALTFIEDGTPEYTFDYVDEEYGYSMRYHFNDNGKVYVYDVIPAAETSPEMLRIVWILDWKKEDNYIVMYQDGEPIGRLLIGEDGTLTPVIE